MISLIFISGCSTGFTIFKQDCPYACCVESESYKVKVCTDLTYSCKQHQCVKCGNDIKEIGENCKTCPQDSPCGDNQACSTDGECIKLGTDFNCASIGHSCKSYEECISNKCEKKICPHECCDGSTYKIKKCESKWDKCDTNDNRCVNEFMDAVGKTGKEIKDTVDKGIDKAPDILENLKIW